MASPRIDKPELTRAWLELHPGALLNNLQQVRQHSASKVMAVIKANAYGHGVEFVAGVLAPHVEAFAVASLEEAVTLRARFSRKPIMLLSGFFTSRQLDVLIRERLRPVIYNLQQIQWLENAGVNGIPMALKLDSGMGRLGIRDRDFAKAVSRVRKLSNDILLMSHFACADTPDAELNQLQHRVFHELCASLSYARSFANSAAILSRPQDHYEMVRPGIMLYGASPLKGVSAKQLKLSPVMRLFARVLDVKSLGPGDSVGYGASWRATQNCRIGIASIGYGDGYPRVIDPQAELAIAGKRYPLVGRVSMDSLAFLIERDDEIKIGTPVELWGETVAIDEVAEWAGTIAYELCCKITPRVQRVELT